MKVFRRRVKVHQAVFHGLSSLGSCQNTHLSQWPPTRCDPLPHAHLPPGDATQEELVPSSPHFQKSRPCRTIHGPHPHVHAPPHVWFSTGMVSPVVLSPQCRWLQVQCDKCPPIAYTTPVATVSWFLQCFSWCEVVARMGKVCRCLGCECQHGDGCTWVAGTSSKIYSFLQFHQPGRIHSVTP